MLVVDAKEGVRKECCLWCLMVAHTCDGHAAALFILGEKPREDQTVAEGEGDSEIGMITEQMWCR